jgi:hypothetical protein
VPPTGSPSTRVSRPMAIFQMACADLLHAPQDRTFQAPTHLRPPMEQGACAGLVFEGTPVSSDNSVNGPIAVKAIAARSSHVAQPSVTCIGNEVAQLRSVLSTQIGGGPPFNRGAPSGLKSAEDAGRRLTSRTLSHPSPNGGRPAEISLCPDADMQVNRPRLELLR